MGRAVQQLRYEQLGHRLNLSRREIRKREQLLINTISNHYQDHLKPFTAALDEHLDSCDGDTTLEKAGKATHLTGHSLKLLIHLSSTSLKPPARLRKIELYD